MKRVVVKLGSSVVADGDGALRIEVLARVCDVLAELHRDGEEVDRSSPAGRSRAACA